MEQTVERFGNDLVRNKAIKTIDSREVAEMLGKRHTDLLQEIEGRKDGKNVGIIPTLLKGKFPLSKFFIEDTYKDKSGRKINVFKLPKWGVNL